MKLKFTCLFLLIAAAAVQCEDVPSQEGIVKDYRYYDQIVKHFKGIGIELANRVVNRAGYLVDDVVRVQATPEANKAVESLNEPSKEGIFSSLAKILAKQALALLTKNPSHESLGSNYSQFPVHELESVQIAILPAVLHVPEGPGHQAITEKPSQEGIFGKLGQLVIGGAGKVIGGTAGDVLSKVGDVLGNIFLVQPRVFDTVHTDEASHEGIFSNIGSALLKGTGKLVGTLAHSVLNSVTQHVGNMFVSRGAFHGYDTFESPAVHIINNYKHVFRSYQAPEYKECIQQANHNYTLLFKEYRRHGRECVAYGKRYAGPLLKRSGSVVNSAIQQYNFVQGVLGNCMGVTELSNRNECLHKTVLPILPILRHNVSQHAETMNYLTRAVDRYNNEFDECVVRHLGYVRSEGVQVIRDFEYCVDSRQPH